MTREERKIDQLVAKVANLERRVERHQDLFDITEFAQVANVKALSERYGAFALKLAIADEIGRRAKTAEELRAVITALCDYDDKWWLSRRDLTIAEWLQTIKAEAARRAAAPLHLRTVT